MRSRQAHSFATPIGQMAICWQGKKVTAVFLPGDVEKNVQKKLGAVDWDPLPPAPIQKIVQKIQKHLSGEPQKFSADSLALENFGPFLRRVYEEAVAIPSGEVRTYGELAAAAGSPKAFRAVGQAMAKNPFPLLVPCHRVVGAGRKMVGFSAPGGIQTKTRLLALETHGRANQS